jgi:hypothetical protein
MQATGSQMGISHRANSPSPGDSLAKLKSKVTIKNGVVSVIGFKMNRSLIWTHVGAGKGRGGSSGSSWIDAQGNRKKTNPESLGKMGTQGRTAKPWFNKFMEGPEGLDDLATIVASELGDAIVGKILI